MQIVPPIPTFIENIPGTVVAKSKVHGWGLWSTTFIPQGALLCVIRGQILSLQDYERLYQSGEFNRNHFVEKTMLPNGQVMAMPFRTSYGFINHNDDEYHIEEIFEPQTGELKIFSRVDIPAGVEIFDRYNLAKHHDVLGGFKHEQLHDYS